MQTLFTSIDAESSPIKTVVYVSNMSNHNIPWLFIEATFKDRKNSVAGFVCLQDLLPGSYSVDLKKHALQQSENYRENCWNNSAHFEAINSLIDFSTLSSLKIIKVELFASKENKIGELRNVGQGDPGMIVLMDQ